jgi:hypothetical protein
VVFFGAQGFIHCEGIPEGRTVKKKINVRRNSASPQGCREKKPSGKMGRKQAVSSARQRTCTAVVDGQKCLSKHNVTTSECRPYSPNLSPPDFLLFPRLISVLKGEQFLGAKEVAAKAMRAQTEVSNNALQKLYKL